MAIIRLLDARRGLYRKCEELFKDAKIAEAIYRYLCDGIAECEDAEPERKRGEWEERKTFYAGDKNPIEEWQSARCSICEKYHTTPYMYFFDDFNFCPNCGAEMREEGYN